MANPLLTIPKPDDFHLHLRQGQDMIGSVAPYSSALFGRATIMPNLAPPIINGAMAMEYKESILSAIPDKDHFTPLMTLYLHHDMNPDQIIADYQDDKFFAIKYYPQHATTLSDEGISDLATMTPLIKAMEQAGIPLLLHGETLTHNDQAVDIFDREKIFLTTTLSWLLDKFPKLKISLEHITTKQAVDFVKTAGNNLGATITCHHLLLNRNALFQQINVTGDKIQLGKNGINPHHYCLPILKREEDRTALLELATSGFPRVFAGTDSAPHPLNQKQSDCGCAGVFSAPVALESYYLAFASVNKLNQLENFLSHNGANFFNLPPQQGAIDFIQQEFTIPQQIKILNSNETIVPFLAGATLPIKAVVASPNKSS